MIKMAYNVIVLDVSLGRMGFLQIDCNTCLVEEILILITQCGGGGEERERIKKKIGCISSAFVTRKNNIF